jgi:hypothetical protein
MALSRGDLAFRLPMLRGDDVRQVQLALTRAGVFKGNADGVFGPLTRDAVVAFQTRLHTRNSGIAIDGIVGRDTWSALFPVDAPVQPVPDVMVPTAVNRTASGDQPAWRITLGSYLPTLNVLHGPPVGTGAKRWMLTPNGVCFDDGGQPPRTSGDPSTARNTWARFRGPLEKCAAAYGVPVELLIATICTESGGDPRCCREEPGFISDSATPDRVSPGLMQTLLSTACTVTRDDSLNRETLLDPEPSIRAGTAYIAQQGNHGHPPTGFDPPLTAIAYNAGSLRPPQAANPANTWGLVQTDRGGGVMHADAFVEFFNDIFAVLGERGENHPDPKTPSFWTIQH